MITTSSTRKSWLPRRSVALILAAIVLIHLVLAVVTILTTRPWSDEGWFFSPAVNLVRHGFLGTTVLDERGGKLAGIQKHTYWVMPLHLVTQAGWYKIFGASILSMRALSVFWSTLGVLAWFVLLERLTRDVRLALLGAAFVAVDYMYLWTATLGRMDGMAAVLGFAAMAAYMGLRERRFILSILLSHTLMAAAVFTHPNAVLHFAGLMFLWFYYDRSRMRFPLLALASLPYLCGLLAWGCYIAQSPADFLVQFRLNAAQGRFSWLLTPIHAIRCEIVERYLTAFGLGAHSSGHFGPIFLKSFILVAYVAAVALALAVPSIRKQRGPRALLYLTLIYVFILTFFNQKLPTYLLHVTPIYCALIAVVVCFLWSKTRFRWLLAAATAGLLVLEAAGTLYRAKSNTFATQFNPAVAFVRPRLRPDSRIIGSAEFAFGLDFDGRVIDDITLGYYSGLRPDMIIVEEAYVDALGGASRYSPVIAAHISNTLARYKLVYDHASYRIYERP